MMPQQNDQSGNPADGRDRDPATAPSGNLGAVYSALLSDPVWQVDAPEPANALASAFAEESAAAEEVRLHAVEPGAPREDPDAAASPIQLVRVVEALLFIGGGPLTTERACSIVRGLTPPEFLRTLDALNRDYRLQDRPYRIRSSDKGHEFVLRPKYLSLVEKMHGGAREARLSSSALDVLALVAYRQPVNKQGIDALRGAESGGILRQLVRRGLLTVVHEETDGRWESVYRTTRRFLEFFALRGLDDLPQTEDLQRL